VIGSAAGASLIAAPSFEARCLAGPEAFVGAGGTVGSAYLAALGGASEELAQHVERLRKLGFESPSEVDRFSAKSIWDWVWSSVLTAKPDVIVDATCIPREMLGMLLFALSVRRTSLERVRIWYTPPGKYATQLDVPEKDKWLSHGIYTLRTILGYPGEFASERKRHVVALAGHEDQRLLEIISFLEPTRLSISNEQKASSTVVEADKLSEAVKAGLRETIGLPEYGDVKFYANSIDQTFESLKDMLAAQTDENVALIAMNTKLSFIGAALCGLHLRHVRLVYAVPIEYNPRYSEGVEAVVERDVTDKLKAAATTPVHSDPAVLLPQV
jgi:hypothetical protein